MAAFDNNAFGRDTAFSSAAFAFLAAVTGPDGRWMPEGRPKFKTSRVGGNLMPQPMAEATKRAVEILRNEKLAVQHNRILDDEEKEIEQAMALILAQFYD